MTKLLEATQADEKLTKLVLNALKPHISKVSNKFKPIDVVVNAKAGWESSSASYIEVTVTYKHDVQSILDKDTTLRVVAYAVFDIGTDTVEFTVENTGQLLFDNNVIFSNRTFPVFGKSLPNFKFILNTKDIIK